MTEKEILIIWIKAGFAVDSDLRYSDLRGSNLSGSDLRGSNLSGSNFSYSNLSGSNLSDSDLRGSNLSDSNLSGSDLSYSDLRGSNLRSSNLDMSSGIPFSCGGTKITLDFNLSIQAIYHVFNQNHADESIKKALEPLRSLAQKFLERRNDAPKLRD